MNSVSILRWLSYAVFGVNIEQKGSWRMKVQNRTVICAALLVLVVGYATSSVGQSAAKKQTTPVQAAAKATRPKPDMNAFKTFDEYEAALVNWKIEQMVNPALNVGRYQIVASPAAMRATFLLDTVTGESWILCNGADAGDTWCSVPRTSSGTSRK
jgi:hypothetical protein